MVKVRLLRGQEAGAVQRALTHQDRRQHEQEAAAGQLVDHIPVQGHLGERDVAYPVREPGAGEPRAAGHVDPAPRGGDLGRVSRLEAELRRLPPAPHQLGVFLVHAVGSGGIGQVRDPGQERVALLGRLSQLCLRLAQLVAERAQLLDLRWRRPPPRRDPLRGAERLSPLGQRTPAGVGGEQRVEVVGRSRAWPGRRGSLRDPVGQP